MTAPQPNVADRLLTNTPGWWCWRCGWWKTELPGAYRPQECGECAGWSRERGLPTDTLRPVAVTLVSR